MSVNVTVGIWGNVVFELQYCIGRADCLSILGQLFNSGFHDLFFRPKHTVNFSTNLRSYLASKRELFPRNVSPPLVYTSWTGKKPRYQPDSIVTNESIYLIGQPPAFMDYLWEHTILRALGFLVSCNVLTSRRPRYHNEAKQEPIDSRQNDRCRVCSFHVHKRASWPRSECRYRTGYEIVLTSNVIYPKGIHAVDMKVSNVLGLSDIKTRRYWQPHRLLNRAHRTASYSSSKLTTECCFFGRASIRAPG